MIEYLINIDTNITIFLNSYHSPILDSIMVIISGKFTWIPLYLLLIYLAYKKDASTVKFIIFLFSIILLVIIADQSSVKLFKNIFERLRPCHCEEIKSIIHIVNNHCGGNFGFVSSHATNVFAIAVFLSLFFTNKKFTAFLILWAAIISFSRIYLGVHYFGDVFGGAILGSFIAFGVYYLLLFSYKKAEKHY